MSAARFTDELRTAADAAWAAQLAHPFVRGLADGSLPLSALACWVRQDYRFLIEYCRLLAYAAARAPDWETALRFVDLLHATARTEMELHRGYAQEFHISPADLEQEPMAPVTRAYTDFLVRTAAVGDFAELAAALLPCMWGYADIGRALDQGPRPADPRLARWIDMYADAEFASLAAWCRDLVDRLAAEAGGPGRARMREAFLTSVQYELAFFDLAWERGEES